MKNLYLSAVVVLSCALFSTKTTAQETVAVNIDLTTPVLSLTVTDPEVTFTYATAEDYVGAKSVMKENHLSVTSSTAFDISVQANTEFISTSNEAINLGIVNIAATPVEENGATLSPVFLALDSDQNIVTDAPAAIQEVFNVDYAIEDATPLLGLPAEMYSTTITYTATAL